MREFFFTLFAVTSLTANSQIITGKLVEEMVIHCHTLMLCCSCCRIRHL